jgi:sugar phosphate isomerase/epimerase
LGDAVDFQVDIFWVVVGGGDPAAVIGRLVDRVVSLHLKDGIELPSSAYAGKPFVNVPVGSGVVDPEPAIKAAEAQASVEWLIVEFDHVVGSPIEATGRSLDYLAERGLGRRRPR